LTPKASPLPAQHQLPDASRSTRPLPTTFLFLLYSIVKEQAKLIAVGLKSFTTEPRKPLVRLSENHISETKRLRRQQRRRRR